MANIRKQFNFRNGVQVDDDNLVVSPTGLVGIGTTIPTEALDVRGNAKIVGVLTATQINAQNLTVPQISFTDATLSGKIIGSGVSIGGGIITSTTGPTGLVTYYGDARYLQGMPTSQWVDIDVGLGFTSIYAAGFVGVGTNDPRFVFQVSGNNNSTLVGFSSGVGISSGGNILATGIVTAYKFVGIGSDIVQLTASNIQYGLINLDRVPTIPDTKLNQFLNLGIVTTTTLTSGIVTATTLSVTGNATVLGSLTGTATTALTLSGTPNIEVGIITASSANIPVVTGNLVGIATTARDLTSNATVTITSITAGVGTFSTKLVAEQIGVGSAIPAKDITLRRSGSAELQIVGETGASVISFGRSESTTGWNGSIRFGNTSAIFPYSLSNSVDYLNYGTGNVNFYLEAGTAGINTGSFYWHKGTTQRLMTLTYQGRLGLGNTDPAHTLEVVGTSTVTNDFFVGGNLNVAANSNLSGNLTVNGNIAVNGSFALPGSISADLNGNVNATSGLSTFTRIFASEFIGIGTTGGTPGLVNPEVFSVNSTGSKKIFIDNGGDIGIKTTQAIPDLINIFAPQANCIISSVGIGTTRPMCLIDFSNATNTAILGPNRDRAAYILPPKLTTTQRNNLTNANNTGVEEGALIYNKSTKKLQVFDGTTWQDCW